MKIEVSNGELIDKYTILRIKASIMKDDALVNVNKELNELEPHVKFLRESYDIEQLIDDLQFINESLWKIEDRVRDLGKRYDENPDVEIVKTAFISNAKIVYVFNDKRAQVKREINKVTSSNLTEEKLYAAW